MITQIRKLKTVLSKVIGNTLSHYQCHIVFAGSYYKHDEKILMRQIETVATEFKFKTLMITEIAMSRSHLITKEKVEDYTNGIFAKEVNEKKYDNMSVNDDLDLFVKNLEKGDQIHYFNYTYFLAKLTGDQLKLVEVRDQDFLKEFISNDWEKIDVQKDEMIRSKSKAKFFRGRCWRKTVTFKNTKIRSLTDIVSDLRNSV